MSLMILYDPIQLDRIEHEICGDDVSTASLLIYVLRFHTS